MQYNAAIIGKKIGMGQVIQESGDMVPVTYVLCEPNEVVQVKESEKDNTDAVVLGAFPLKNPKKTKKHYVTKQFATFEKEVKKGDSFALADLGEVASVTVSGVSKGKGFQGGVKRHNFKTARHTHGTKDGRHGSTWGQSARGGKTPKGVRMSGHMGNENTTVHRRKVITIDIENNVIALKGSVPGATGSYVFLQKES